MLANRLHTLVMLAAVAALCQHSALAQQGNYVQHNGVTYLETRQIVRQPVWETHYENRQQTIYRPQLKTETQRLPRTVYTPVTEYRCVATLRGRWNPFAVPYYTYDLQPFQYWRTEQAEADVTVQTYDWVPETRTVSVPVTTQRMAEREIVRRVAVAAPANGGTEPRYGGIALLGEGPTRYGTRAPAAAAATAWRPAGQAVRR